MGGELQFWTKGLAGNLAERMRIDSTGKVGIGTTAPDVHLAILGSGSTAYATTISSGRNSGSDLLWLKNSNASAGYVGIYLSVDNTQNPEGRIALTNEAGFDGDLTFAIRDPSDTGNVKERLRITSAGNVTIAAGGDLETSTTGKVKQKGAFMQSSTHQALTLGY